MTTAKHLPNPNNDKVLAMIAALQDKVMIKRLDLWKAVENNAPDVADREIVVKQMQDTLDDIIKSYLSYQRVVKASGVRPTDNSKELLQKMQDIQSNVGSIVSKIPGGENGDV